MNVLICKWIYSFADKKRRNHKTKKCIRHLQIVINGYTTEGKAPTAWVKKY